MDYIALASIGLTALTALGGMVLSAYHVKNATAITNDAHDLASDALTAMGGSVSGAGVKLAAAAPALLRDGAKLAEDTFGPSLTPAVAVAASVLPQAAADLTAVADLAAVAKAI